MSKKSFALLALPAALAVTGIGAVNAGQGSAGPVRCEIQVSEHGSGVSLEGVVYAKSAVEGSYRLRVSKAGGSGSSDIDQSGDFSAGPGAAASLGNVTLGGDGSYVARLRVTVDGRSVECTERVGGML
jgi:hypothetical protein